jgi:hypothetical protein
VSAEIEGCATDYTTTAFLNDFSCPFYADICSELFEASFYKPTIFAVSLDDAA